VESIVLVSAEGEAKSGRIRVSVGTGFFVSSDGYIVTAAHVLKSPVSDDPWKTDSFTKSDAVVATIRLPDRQHYIPATIVFTDDQTDLAILKASIDDMVPLRIGDSSSIFSQQDLSVGIWGNDPARGRSVLTKATVGQPSLRGMIELLLLGAGPGDSGSPVLDAGGRVVGVYTQNDPAAEGRGFAIPINYAATILSMSPDYSLASLARRMSEESRDAFRFLVEDLGEARIRLQAQQRIIDSMKIAIDYYLSISATKSGYRLWVDVVKRFPEQLTPEKLLIVVWPVARDDGKEVDLDEFRKIVALDGAKMQFSVANIEQDIYGSLDRYNKENKKELNIQDIQGLRVKQEFQFKIRGGKPEITAGVPERFFPRRFPQVN
ncbi:MAG: serine protease, partial [Proteobacteria bacterium]|nr:serine protease [Pseudomonadota bacterium]